MHDSLACVRGAEIFNGLDENTVKALAEIATHQRPVEKGTFLYEPGAPVAALLVVDRGLVKVTRPTPEGQEKVLYFLGAHSVDSEAALFAEQTHRNEAVAVEDTLICTINRQDFQTLLERSPKLAVRMLNAFGTRLTALETRSARYGTLTAQARLQQYLEDLSAQLGTRHLTLPMSKRDLASWLSITPETLSRQFAKLTAAGVLTTRGQKVILK